MNDSHQLSEPDQPPDATNVGSTLVETSSEQFRPALTGVLLLTLVSGVIFPLALFAIARPLFPHQIGGSLLTRDGAIVGSELIGQGFTGPGYFHPRPSAAGDGYDGASSSASNLGPTNEELVDAVRERAEVYRRVNGLAPGDAVPVEAVTASGSGLDPHISTRDARIQAGRVAAARGLAVEAVLALVDEHTDGRSLGFLGEPGVNVLELNLALDESR
jgi:K+-transporting ATPase ATPase C chain